MKYNIQSFLENKNIQTKQDLLCLLKKHQGETFTTFIEVMRISYMIAEELYQKKEFSLLAAESGLFHDIGKIGLSKEYNDGKVFTDEMFIEMKNHPEGGALLLEKVKAEKELIEAARYHQENINGSGYPRGLKEEEIPIIASIVQVADSVNAALDKKRTYKIPVNVTDLEKNMMNKVGVYYRKEVVEAFLNGHRKIVATLTDDKLETYYKKMNELYDLHSILAKTIECK